MDFKSATLDNVRVDEFFFCSNFDSGNLGKVEVVPPDKMTGLYIDSSFSSRRLIDSFSILKPELNRNKEKQQQNNPPSSQSH